MASGMLDGVRLWDDRDPYLYRVYSLLTIDGKVVDAVPQVTGFRKTEFRGGGRAKGAFT